MKQLALVIALATTACASSPQPAPYAPMSTEAYFHSWYHGYFLHSIFGLGQLGEYDGEPYVLCGAKRVPIRAVFDTHMYAGQEPGAGQTQEDVTSHNLALLARFAEAGVSCRIPGQWAQDA